MPAAFTDDVAEQIAFMGLLGQYDALLYEFRGGVAACHRDFDGVIQYTLGQSAYFVGERGRSEEHTSELQSLMRISLYVLCFEKKKTHSKNIQRRTTHKQ